MADIYKRNPPTCLVTCSANENASEPNFNGSTEQNGSIISNHLDQTDELRVAATNWFSIFDSINLLFSRDEKECDLCDLS